MSLPTPAKVCLGVGLVGLALAVTNQFLAPSLEPPLERAGVLASLLAVSLLVVSGLWTRAIPEAAAKFELGGDQVLEIKPELPDQLRLELAWGSQMLLTTSAAACLLLLWRGEPLLRRGLAIDQTFIPGSICERAMATGRAISLVDLKLYPGRAEFDDFLPGLPAVVVQPIGQEGLLLLGGWSPRCFGRSDLMWIEGWSEKLIAQLETFAA
ncbi:cofactor assembly of complex C subunit B [Cyanobium sp. HWJ4-Hawea]|uniref:cofactor assembly of complex C subunit B n=1 Tax=Cyanobium sp. HWJ4-Hawea TaxID=2823713 RepID=UPI0020CEAB2F|nr:cofactor assembly of complex C subunit B [Cyanobium sp. HWJ4-Hawea]